MALRKGKPNGRPKAAPRGMPKAASKAAPKRARRSKGKSIGTLACLVIVGAIAWGGYSAHSTLSFLLQADAALASSPALYVANRDAKSDKLPGYRLASFSSPKSVSALTPIALPAVVPPVTATASVSLAPPQAPPAQAPVVMASLGPQSIAPLDADASAVTSALPESSKVVVHPVVPQRPEPRQTEARPVEKPKPKPTSTLLDDSQIANIKGRLKLTADQEGYWAPVEAALKDVVKQQMREAKRKEGLGPVAINVNSPEVQRLTWAAMPLLMRMREDQKREVRTLARVIGLDSVASQI